MIVTVTVSVSVKASLVGVARAERRGSRAAAWIKLRLMLGGGLSYNHSQALSGYTLSLRLSLTLRLESIARSSMLSHVIMSTSLLDIYYYASATRLLKLSLGMRGTRQCVADLA